VPFFFLLLCSLTTTTTDRVGKKTCISRPPPAALLFRPRRHLAPPHLRRKMASAALGVASRRCAAPCARPAVAVNVVAVAHPTASSSGRGVTAAAVPKAAAAAVRAINSRSVMASGEYIQASVPFCGSGERGSAPLFERERDEDFKKPICCVGLFSFSFHCSLEFCLLLSRIVQFSWTKAIIWSFQKPRSIWIAIQSNSDATRDVGMWGLDNFSSRRTKNKKDSLLCIFPSSNSRRFCGQKLLIRILESVSQRVLREGCARKSRR